MSLIFLLLTIILLLTNLAGLAVLLQRWIPYYALAKAVGIIGFCLALFFTEHFIGLGRATWLWPLTTAIAAFILYKNRAWLISAGWRQELIFVSGFFAVLFWKFSFPDIDAHSEQLTDLALISSYYPGEQLPPWDHWLPDHRLNMYYAFLHYSTALLGRIFGLPMGYAMNLAIVIVYAMATSLIWLVTSQFSQARIPRALLGVAILVGGTGLAPLTHFIFDQHRADYDRAFTATRNIWANTRFAGMYDAEIDTQFGKRLFPSPPKETGPNAEMRDLPLETMGYLLFLGDLHPPLGGFVLMFIAIACIVLIERKQHEGNAHYLQAVLAATVPLALITNAWVLPLQALLVAGWGLSRWQRRETVYWKALIVGAGFATGLSYPFLSQFALQALHTPFGWVKTEDHTPLNYFLIIHWPALILLVIGLIASWRQTAWRHLLIILAVLLLLSEWIYVDDPMDGKYNRFNSALKWWSWLYPAILVIGGSILLGAHKLWRGITVVVLLLVATMSIDLLIYWLASDKSARGQLSGTHWLTVEPAHRQMLNWLQQAPDGVVLEGLSDGGAYTPTSALALFSGKASLTGWPDHEAQWRGNPTFIYDTANEVRRFYRAELPEALPWLDGHHVQYIAWMLRDQQRDPTMRPRIHELIKTQYDWRGFWKNGNDEVGIWVRRPS